jgi:hypothetical protein
LLRAGGAVCSAKADVIVGMHGAASLMLVWIDVSAYVRTTSMIKLMRFIV